MRVCFISHSAGKYGAELALLELLQGLSKSGVHCLVLVPKKGPLLTELDRLNIEWRVIRYPPWISRKKQLPYRILRTFKGLAAVVRMAMAFSQWRCDLVYTNTIAVSAGAFAARLLRKPHIWHSHESGYRNPRVKFDLGNRWAARLIDRLSMIIIVVSHSIADDYSPFIKPERMRLIYQSVTPHDEVEEAIDSPSNKKSFKCVIVGSLDPWKGQDEAIKALSELIRRGIDAELLVVGDGKEPFKAELHQQIKDHGLEQRVKFSGYVKNPMQLVRMSDVMLLCSDWEAFPRVTIEAMLAGKAVIGSARGGTIEQIQNGETGLLYERGNYLQLADKIQYLYENPEAKLKLEVNASSWAKGRFTQERYAKEVLDLFRELLTKKTSFP